jgi:N-methylhydantoinase B
VLQEKVSRSAAKSGYGVVLDGLDVDSSATESMRDRLKEKRGRLSMFDRGAGYKRLSGGRDRAEVDDL